MTGWISELPLTREISVGSIKMYAIESGVQKLDGGAMFGVVPKPLWERRIPPDKQNRIPLALRCLVLETPDELVLVDTGIGNKESEKFHDLYGIENAGNPTRLEDGIEEAGFIPQDISIVVCTHLHFDHAGGLTRLDQDGHATATFPNAHIHVQMQEWEDAKAGRSTMTGTYLHSNLDPVADQIVTHEGDSTIMSGIRVMPVPGHTWGQQAVLVETVDGTLCFPGDLLPTRHHIGASYSMGYDMLPWENMRTKQGLLSFAADNSWLLVLDHEPGHPVFTVRHQGEWFELLESDAG